VARPLDGKAAIVTGGGGGIGRAIAMRMASEGASVIVNDLGCAPDGAGASTGPAQEVVSDIARAGGTAVADLSSVADSRGADRLVRTAINSFGHVDILVNCAGIIRGQPLWGMSDETWDVVIRVNLHGSFYCTRAAVREMRYAILEGRQKGGRIINFTSESGIFGNGVNSNYGAAKAGIIGLTKSSAIGLRELGITCNAVSPRAETRIVAGTTEYRWRDLGASIGIEDAESMPLADLKRKLGSGSPEGIVPLVLWLASERSADVTGRVFIAHEGWVGVFAEMAEKKVEFEGDFEDFDRVVRSVLTNPPPSSRI